VLEACGAQGQTPDCPVCAAFGAQAQGRQGACAQEACRLMRDGDARATKLSVEGATKYYQTKTGQVHALEDYTMQVKVGELVCVLGPSGCGKSTLLWSMAGLHGLTRGKVMLDKQSIVKPHPQIAMVFQEANLLPWRNLIRNIELPFELKNLSPSKYRARIDALLEKVGLAGFENKYPRELSGGMQQRASIVRSLAVDPSVLLMDEPFGALDAFTRDEMNLLIQQIWMETGKTIVFITHNIAEAIFLADRIFVMSPRPAACRARSRSAFRGRASSRSIPRPPSSRSSARSRDRSSMAAGTRPSTSSDRGSLPMADNLLQDKIPTFDKKGDQQAGNVSLSNWSALTSGPGVRTWFEIIAIALVAVAVIGGIELWIYFFKVPQYIFPRPLLIGQSMIEDFPVLWPHIIVTVKELVSGFAIGATIGMVLAALITQSPFAEKIVTPYVVLLVCTPMIALVPLLILRFGFGSEPRIIAVTLAVYPMVMINSATGFRRVDLAKIALARSFGASTFRPTGRSAFPWPCR